MASRIIVLGAFAIAIVIVEAVMWKLYIARRAGIEFPTEVDTSIFRWLTNGKAKIIFLIQMTVLLASTLLPLWFLW